MSVLKWDFAFTLRVSLQNQGTSASTGEADRLLPDCMGSRYQAKGLLGSNRSAGTSA